MAQKLIPTLCCFNSMFDENFVLVCVCGFVQIDKVLLEYVLNGQILSLAFLFTLIRFPAP